MTGGERRATTRRLQDRVRDAIEALKVWRRRGERAPHKPLLLIYALGRLQRGESRLVSFSEAEEPLRKLLQSFGPPRASHHPELPFWHLQSDGLWQVTGAGELKRRQGSNNPPVTEMRKAEGGFPTDVYEMLRKEPAFVERSARRLLDTHFPPTLHEDILNAAGLSLNAARQRARRRRDAGFREEVLIAYGYQCAICRLSLQFGGVSCGLEAAHVRWDSQGGLSEVHNGLCLCPLHHKALDMGILGLDPSRRVIVSQLLQANESASTHLVRFHGHSLHGPQSSRQEIASDNIKWHTTEVFKGPARE